MGKFKLPFKGFNRTPKDDESQQINQFIIDLIHQLPAGKARIDVPYEVEGVPDACVELKVIVDSDGRPAYSSEKLQNLVKAIILHRKKNDQTLLSVFSYIPDTTNGYGLSILMQEDGNFIYSHPEGEREYSNEGTHVTMVDSIEELNYLVTSGLNEAPEVQSNVALIEKIIRRLPVGNAMLVIGFTFDDNGTPDHLQVKISDDGAAEYSEEELLEFAQKIMDKIAIDNIVILFTMVNDEERTYALGIGVTPKEHFYVPVSDMRDTFGFAEDIGVLDTLDALASISRD